MGSLCAKNAIEKFSRLGTFKKVHYPSKHFRKTQGILISLYLKNMHFQKAARKLLSRRQICVVADVDPVENTDSVSAGS
jgi:hypothetical protein